MLSTVYFFEFYCKILGSYLLNCADDGLDLLLDLLLDGVGGGEVLLL